MASLLANRELAHAWELRTAWATQREVVLRLDPDAVGPWDYDLPGLQPYRVQGLVTRVATTGAFAVISVGEPDPVHVPVITILAISYPHFHEVGGRQLFMFAPPLREEPRPGQLSLIRQLARKSRGRRWHLPHPADPAVSACGRAELIGESLDAEEIAEKRRCRSPGCRGMWPS